MNASRTVAGGMTASLPAGLPRSDGLLFLAYGFACVAISWVTDPANWQVLGLLGPLAILLALLRVRRLLAEGQESVVSNVFLTFTLAFMLFFLFGPLLLVYGPENQAEISQIWYAVTADQAVRVLGANILGFGIAVGVGEIFRFEGFSRRLAGGFRRLPSFGRGAATALSLIAIGIVFRAWVIYNDLFIHEVVAGLLRMAQMFVPAGVFLFAYRERLTFRPATLFVILAVLFYSATGVIEFNKQQAILPVIALTGGVIVRHATFPRLLAAMGVLGAMLALLQPISLSARNEVIKQLAPSFQDRVAILQRATSGELSIDELPGIWSRLEYTAPQLAAMDLYEMGDGDDSYTLIPWAFLPRALAPSKPNMTMQGTKFTEKVQGWSSSATGVGIFVSGFYDLGWVGLALASALIGFILSWYRAVIRAAQRADSIFLLFIGLFGHMAALLISEAYLLVFGQFVMILYGVLLAWGAAAALTRPGAA
jgi:hypothetical protein